MKKELCVLIQNRVFPFDVLVTTMDNKSLYKYIERSKCYVLNDEEKSALELIGNGKATQLRGGQVIVRLPKQKTITGIDLADLAHELQHATFFIMSRVGIKHTEDSDEVFSYFQSFLMRSTLEKLNQ